MKVLHVLYTNKLSGAENVAGDICMMVDENFEMAYCSLNGPIAAALADRGIRFLPLASFTYRELKKVIHSFSPDVIHAHDVRATVLVSLVAGPIPFISHLHVNNGDMNRPSRKAFLYKWAVRKAAKVIAVSDSCFADYVYNQDIKNKTDILKNIIYPNRLNTLAAYDTNDYTFDFIFVGRLTDQKDPERMAKVASEVLKAVPSSQFGVIGEGDMRKAMESVFEQEKVRHQVTFTGRLAYPYKAMQSSSCLLMCSKFEGTPIAALEAMAFKLPIVSTPVDGMQDLVTHEETGFLYADDANLSRAVVRLVTSEDLRNEMGEKSYHLYTKLNDHEQYKMQIEQLYREVADQSSLIRRAEVPS
ncbi:glycosyltransferase [Alkalibacterium sp. AK22]|uniref:glycosyltransferase n=1 Tax=Alkalibacterium sp. AK22 TaxID=1229520 RepID=UPI000557393B|nr:glycosyltransferase [Alkalibacterium sp. AK22]